MESYFGVENMTVTNEILKPQIHKQIRLINKGKILIVNNVITKPYGKVASRDT